MNSTVKLKEDHPGNTPYQVNEIFTSVQGEGYHTGVFATFIRLQGCPVGCHWCDTKYTWAKGGTKMTVQEILTQVEANHVVITGGEPMLYNLDDLLLMLKGAGKYVQIETSGLNWFKGHRRPDWVTVSPKENLNFEVPEEAYHFAQEFKWVVDLAFQAECMQKVLDNVAYRFLFVDVQAVKLSLMPEGCPAGEDTILKTLGIMREFRHVPFRFADRLQYRIHVR